MPTDTDTDTKPDVDDDKTPPGRRRGDKSDPPASSGPSEDDIRSFVREELVKMIGGADKTDAGPDLSTDKKLEAYVREITRTAVEELKAAEEAAGKPSPDDKPDESHEPENEPQQTKPWTERVQAFLWGPGK